jgi:hypothetical protein
MQFLMIATLVAILSFDFLASEGYAPGQSGYMAELLAIFAAAIVVAAGSKGRFKYVRPAYWLVFGALALVLVCGAIVNSLEPGPMFAGLRTYLRAIPFFFLPAVLAYSEGQIRRQLVVLACLCALQLPLAWYQRINEPYLTGDTTYGTLMESGLLSVFMICAACVLTGFYLTKRIRTWPYVLLLVCFLGPTTLNETKATLFMLPIALLTTFYAGSKKGTRLKNTALGFVLLAAFLAIFIPIYDSFMRPRWGYGILDFLTMEGRVEGYLVKGAEVGSQREGGRFDGLFAAVSELSKDPLTLTFGFGIGNTSESALGDQFTGAYYYLFANLPVTSSTALLLDYGFLGVGLVLLLHWLIFRDSLLFARQDGEDIVRAIAIGWTGVSAVVLLGMFYTKMIPSSAVSFMYWYFSGLIVAARMRAVLRTANAERAPAQQPLLTT